MYFRIIVVCLLLLSAACSGPVRKPQEQAIFQALVQDVTLRKLADYCGQLDADMQQYAWRARKEWWDRNQAFVEAADFGFAYHLLDLTGDRQETGARYAMALAYDVDHEAGLQAAKVTQANNQQRACTAELKSYLDGKQELKNDQDMYPMLLDLLQQKETRSNDLLLKQSRVVEASGYSYSRSSATAERLAKRQHCPGVVVSALKADWPLEIFEASCPDKSFALIECEWGQCKIK